MTWSLAAALADTTQALPLGGGLCEDIAGLAFSTLVLRKLKDRIHAYVAAMRATGKTPACIRLAVDDYRRLVDAVAKQRGVKRAEICGLKHDGIPVVADRAE